MGAELRRSGDQPAGRGRDRRDLLRRLLRTQEDERRRLAGDLHDEVIQPLVAGMLQLDVLNARMSRLGEAERAPIDEVVRRIRDDVEHALRHARGFLLALRPPLLDSEGLEPAVAQQLIRLADRTGARTELAWLLDRRLDADLEAVVFRFVQEALANVARHARAAAVRVRIERDGREVRVEVSDDGVGFDQARDARGEHAEGHLGLRFMAERVAATGGRLEVASASGHGTTVVARLPLLLG